MRMSQKEEQLAQSIGSVWKMYNTTAELNKANNNNNAGSGTGKLRKSMQDTVLSSAANHEIHNRSNEIEQPVEARARSVSRSRARHSALEQQVKILQSAKLQDLDERLLLIK